MANSLQITGSPLKITGFPLKITGFPLKITGFPLNKYLNKIRIGEILNLKKKRKIKTNLNSTVNV